MNRGTLIRAWQIDYEKFIAGRVFESKSQAEAQLIPLLNKYFAQLDEGGRVSYLWFSQNPQHPATGESFELALSNQSDIKSWFLGEEISYGSGSDLKTTTVFELWRNHRDRRKLTDVIFDASGCHHSFALNLWFGYGCIPSEGDISLFKNFLVEVVCGNEPDPVAASEELLKLIAWKFQNPTERPEKSLVIRGGKGTGKNVFVEILCQMMGWAYCRITASREDLFGRFNAHLQHTAFMVLNEAFWRGHNGEEAILKQLITENSMPIERKFGAKSSAKNSLMIIMMANAEWVIPASEDERRFVVYEMANAYQQNTTYFAKLYEHQYKNGGNEALLYHLLNYELDGWHPRDMRDTKGLATQKLYSRDLVEQWLIELIEYPEDILAYAETPSEAIRLDETVQKSRNYWLKSNHSEWFPVWKPLVTTPQWEFKSLVLGRSKEAYWLFTKWLKDNEHSYENRKPSQSQFTGKLKSLLPNIICSKNNDLQSLRPSGNKDPIKVIKLPPRPEMLRWLKNRTGE